MYCGGINESRASELSVFATFIIVSLSPPPSLSHMSEIHCTLLECANGACEQTCRDACGGSIDTFQCNSDTLQCVCGDDEVEWANWLIYGGLAILALAVCRFLKKCSKECDELCCQENKAQASERQPLVQRAQRQPQVVSHAVAAQFKQQIEAAINETSKRIREGEAESVKQQAEEKKKREQKTMADFLPPKKPPAKKPPAKKPPAKKLQASAPPLESKEDASPLGRWFARHKIRTSEKMWKVLDELGVEDWTDLKHLDEQDIELICKNLKKISAIKFMDLMKSDGIQKDEASEVPV